MLPVWQIISIVVLFCAIAGLAYYLATRGSVAATAVADRAAGGSLPLKVDGMSLAIDTTGPSACLPDDMIKDSLMAALPVVRMTGESTRLLMELLRGEIAYNMFTLEPPKAGDVAGYWLTKTIGDTGAAAVARTLGLANTAASGNQFVVYMEFPSKFSVETHGAGEFLADKAFFFAGTARSLKPSTVRSQWQKSCNPPMPDITVRCKAGFSQCEYVGDGSAAASAAAGEEVQLMSSCAPAFLASRLLFWLPEQSDVASYAACSKQPAPTMAPTTTQAATTMPAPTTRATTRAATTMPATASATTTRPATTTRAATTQAATTQAATTRAATTRPNEECAGVDPSVKGPCYVHDESLNAGGPNVCSFDMDCSGMRTCSLSGYCGEGAEYTRPAWMM